MNQRKQIGDYRVIERLGCGGAGEVFLATPINNKKFANAGEPVAIKCYNERVLSASNQLDRIRREFNVGSQLESPYLVHMHECNISSTDGPHLVMEYIDGMPLSDWIQMFYPISEALLVRTLIRVAQAIRTLHEAKTVHRDIKPENIMMSSDFVPKLMDFGVVKIEHVEGETPSDSFIGTIRNASPEWLQSKGAEYDARTDLYSFGTVIYAMLHRHQVFHHERQFARLVQLVINEKPGVDEALRSRLEPVPTLLLLAEKLMEKSSDNRPASMDEVLNVLEVGNKSLPTTEIKPLHGYMATALTNVPEDAHDAIAFKSRHVADVCKEFGVYVYQPRMVTDPLLNPNVDAEVVYARDRKRILTADLLIISADYPSFGVGQEIEIAASFGVPTIIIQKQNKAKLSRMITGSPLNLIGEIAYATPEDLSEKLRALIGSKIDKIRSFEDSIRPEISQQIGARLREIRQQAGLSVQQAAMKIGTSSRLIQAAEERPLNEHNIGLHVFGRLLVAYGSSITEVFGPAKSAARTTTTVDHNLRTLEDVARNAGWSALDYLELREDYEKQIAAFGDTERVEPEQWLQRLSALQKRRLQDKRAKESRVAESGDLFTV